MTFIVWNRLNNYYYILKEQMEIYKQQTLYCKTKDVQHLEQVYKQSMKLIGYILNRMGCSLPQHIIDDMKEDIVTATIIKIQNGKVIDNFYSYYKKALYFHIMNNKKYQSKFNDFITLESIERFNTDEASIETVRAVMSIIERYLEGEPITIQIRIIEKLIKFVGRQKTIHTYFYWMSKKEKKLLSFILQEVRGVLYDD